MKRGNSRYAATTEHTSNHHDNDDDGREDTRWSSGDVTSGGKGEHLAMTRVEPDRNTSPYPDLTEVEDISDTSTAPYPTLMEGKKLEESDSVRRRSPPTEETKLPEDQDCMEWDEPDLPTHINPCCPSCTPQTSFPCRILFFLVILGLDLADLFSDWLLFVDVYLTEEGLVYGPPEAAATYCLLAFSIIGTLTFVFEAVNLWWEVFRNNPWVDTDLVSALVIWLEDLPQIAINVYIAMCREDPISVFQLTKASIVLIGLMIRIIISSVKYCNKAALREARLRTKESRRHVTFRVFIMLGLLINAGCAVTVFVFTQTQRDADGKITFQVPDTIFEDRYHDERYFQNVSVFIHHPDFDASTPNASTSYEANWVRFMSINDIRDQDDLDISYNYIYEPTDTHLKMALYIKKDRSGKGKQGKWELSECYTMEWTSRDIAAVDNVTCRTSFFTNQSISTFITFSFTPPDTVFRRLIFGDIRFNIKVQQDGECTLYDNFTDAVGNNVHIPAIHYYRINANIPASNRKHLLVDSGGQPRFYRNDEEDLEDIIDLWRTGWGRCDSSGSMAPHLDRDIPTECNNIPNSLTG